MLLTSFVLPFLLLLSAVGQAQRYSPMESPAAMASSAAAPSGSMMEAASDGLVSPLSALVRISPATSSSRANCGLGSKIPADALCDFCHAGVVHLF
jgi:hypothetical protein